MKAPEKIYRRLEDKYIKYYDYKPAKISYNEKEPTEYTRTDAFIEKACNGIEKLLSGYIIRNFHFGDSYDIDRLIEDFKNYMKGA